MPLSRGTSSVWPAVHSSHPRQRGHSYACDLRHCRCQLWHLHAPPGMGQGEDDYLLLQEAEAPPVASGLGSSLAQHKAAISAGGGGPQPGGLTQPSGRTPAAGRLEKGLLMLLGISGELTRSCQGSHFIKAPGIAQGSWTSPRN